MYHDLSAILKRTPSGCCVANILLGRKRWKQGDRLLLIQAGAIMAWIKVVMVEVVRMGCILDIFRR